MITDGEGGVNDEVGSFEGEHLLGDGFGDTGGAGALLDLDGYDLLGGEERSRAFVATLDPGLVDFVLEGRVEGLGPGELGLGIIVEPALETVFAEPEVSLSVLVADGTAEVAIGAGGFEVVELPGFLTVGGLDDDAGVGDAKDGHRLVFAVHGGEDVGEGGTGRGEERTQDKQGGKTPRTELATEGDRRDRFGEFKGFHAATPRALSPPGLRPRRDRKARRGNGDGA